MSLRRKAARWCTFYRVVPSQASIPCHCNVISTVCCCPNILSAKTQSPCQCMYLPVSDQWLMRCSLTPDVLPQLQQPSVHGNGGLVIATPPLIFLHVNIARSKLISFVFHTMAYMCRWTRRTIASGPTAQGCFHGKRGEHNCGKGTFAKFMLPSSAESIGGNSSQVDFLQNFIFHYKQ